MARRSARIPKALGPILGILLVVAVSGTALLVGRRWDGSLRRLQQEGVIRIGYAVEAPYAFLDPSGTVTGESPEIARRVVQALGIREIQWRLVDFRMLIDELESGRVDVIAAGMFITPERARRVAFSQPTFHVRQGLLVRKDASPRLHAYEEAAAQPALRIAVLSGSVEEAMLRRLGSSPQQILVVPDALTGLAAVKAGMVEGLALSSPTVRWMALQDESGGMDMAGPFSSPGPGDGSGGHGAFAFRPGDRRLREAWDEILRSYVGSREHLELVSRFGFTRDDLPAPGGAGVPP